jgi:pimeloyl-ACP methyl ester carboxylesterase
VTEAPPRVLPVAGRPAAWVEVGSGSGPLLVLVHGAGGSADLWQPQLDGLADVARIVAPDLPGHGLLGGRGDVSIAAYADTIPGARLVEVPAAGHFPQLEQPAPVKAAIRRFVAELRDASIGTVPVRLED